MGDRTVWRGFRTFFIVGALLVGGRAEAFSTLNHDWITRAAAEQIRVCVDLHKDSLPEWARSVSDEVDDLASCNVAQDAVFKKLLVWHFYAPEGIKRGWDPLKWTPALTTFHPWYDILVAQANSDKAPGGGVGTLGALLHYLQDMAVPAHVVPIFHPRASSWGDNFDDFGFEPVEPATDLATCKRLFSDEVELGALLSEVAKATQASIRQPVDKLRDSSGKPANQHWSIFWNEERKAKTFGVYGCVGDVFGRPSVKCGDDRFLVPSQTYHAFAAARQKAAVEASVRAIVGFEKRSGQAKVAGAQKCPVPVRVGLSRKVRIKWKTLKRAGL
jgi:hypothetical protein